MWRILQTVPRAVRNQLNSTVRSAQQTACREGDNSTENRICLYQPFQASHSSPVFYSYCNHSGQEHDQYRSHQHEQPGDKSGHEQSGSRQQRRQREQTTDTNWEEWLRSFRKDFYSAAGHPHSTLEAVGWGTALLLGLHLSKYYHLRNRQCTRHEHPNETSWAYHLYQLALAMPQLPLPTSPHGWSVGKYCILPSQADTDLTGQQEELSNDTGQSFKPKVRDKVSWAWDSLLDTIQAETGEENQMLQNGILQNDAQSLKTERRSSSLCTPPDYLAEARAEWDKLTRLYQGAGANLAACQYTDTGQIDQALTLWKQASELGYSKANYNLGLCYESGKGVEVDLQKAVEFYSLAAVAGHGKAMYNLALLYLKGFEGLDADKTKATELLEKAAQLGLCRAQTDLGVLYTEEGRNMKEASALFEQAADEQDAAGQYYLGVCYENGWGVPCNACKAAELYTKSANQGHASAMYNLGVFFERGLGGLPVNKESALQWYKAAAEKGDGAAMKDVQRLQSERIAFGLNLDEILGYPWKEYGRKSHLGKSQGLFQSASSPSLGDHMKVRLILSTGFADTDNPQLNQDMFKSSERVLSQETAVVSDKSKEKSPINSTKKSPVKTESSAKFYLSDEDSDMYSSDESEESENNLISFGDGNFGENIPGLVLTGSFGSFQLGRNPIQNSSKENKTIIKMTASGSFGSLTMKRTSKIDWNEPSDKQVDNSEIEPTGLVDITFDASSRIDSGLGDRGNSSASLREDSLKQKSICGM